VRKSEDWVIGVVVGWSSGSKLLRLSLVLCEKVFFLLHEAISGWIKACWALMATLEGEGVPQYHQKQCLLLDEKLRAGGHMWTVSYKA